MELSFLLLDRVVSDFKEFKKFMVLGYMHPKHIKLPKLSFSLSALLLQVAH